jgi:excisionase family DNA binding protein
VAIELSAAQLEAIAQRVAEILRPPAPVEVAWLDAAGAAEHLACSRERIYDLVQRRELSPRRDGRRLVFRRADLDSYLEERAA